GLQPADARRHDGEGDQRRAGAHPHVPSRRLRQADRQVMARQRSQAQNGSGNGYAPRLKQLYESELRARLKDELAVSTVMQVPTVSKITLNMGVGEAKTEAKALDSA